MEDKGLQGIIKAAGVIMAVLGILMTWRGVTRMIPATGLANGMVYVLVGILFALTGLAILVVPVLRARRKKDEDPEDKG